MDRLVVCAFWLKMVMERAERKADFTPQEDLVEFGDHSLILHSHEMDCIQKLSVASSASSSELRISAL